MIEYRLENGKLAKVKPEHVQQFLEKHPNATPVSGNQESPAEGAPIGQESAVPNQEASQSQNNTDSSLEVGSLESLSKVVTNSYSELESTNSKLEKLKSAMGDARAFNNEALYNSLSEEYNNTISVNEENRIKYKNVAKQHKALYRAEEAKKVEEDEKATEEEANKLGHGFLSPLIHLTRGFTSFAQGIGSFTEGIETGVMEWWDEADLGLLKEPGEEWTPEKRKKAGLAVKAERLVMAAAGSGPAIGSSMLFEPAMMALDAEIPEFDTNITQDFSNGDYLKAAHRTVDGFFASAPSFIAAMIPGGLALLAASTAGNKYEEEVLANPDMDTGTLLVNATGSGLIEAGFEYVTRGLLKKTGLIQTGSVAVAKEYLEYSSKHILKKFGLGGWSMVKEGSSEAATELTSALWDAIPKDKGGLGKEMKYDDVFYRMSDAFIIGSFSGGVFESVGAMSSGNSKKNAEAVLMSEELKGIVSVSNKKISELASDLDEAIPEEKELIQEQIKAEAEKIKSIHGRNSKTLSTLEGKALQDYADNVDKINRVKKAHKGAKTDIGRELALDKYNKLTEANSDILKESIQSYTEKSVSNMQTMASKLSESGGPSGTITTKTATEIEAMDMGFDKDDDGNIVLDKDGNKVKKSTLASKQYGTIIQQSDGGYEIVINKDVPAIGVAGHEFFHAILFNTLGKDLEVAKSLQEALDGHVNSLSGNQTAMRERLNESYEGSEDLSEETITIMSESILNGSLKYDEGFFTKIGDILRRFLQGKGIPGQDIKLDTGKDVFNFVKDFVNSIETGKVNKAITKVGAEGAKGKLVDKGRAKTEAKAKANAKPKGKPDADVKFSREDVKPEVDELGNMGWTKGTWKSQGADLAIAEMQANKMLDGLIAAKMKGGLRDGDNETKKDFISKVYSELTAHVKNFNPESNDSLFGWVNSQVSNKAGNVYNREYKDKSLERAVDIDATTSEGAPLVQIEADTDILMQRIDEIGLDETEVEQRSKLRRAIRLDESMMQTVRNAVIKTFGTKLPNVESKKFRAALEKAFRTELKKPLQDLMGGRSEYDLFLRNHIKAIVKALPVGTLVQMERNLKPEQRIFTESRRVTKSTEVDKLVSEGKLPKDTSRTSGPQLHTKKTFPGIEKAMAYFRGKDMEAVLGYKVGASTLGTRKDKLAMELGVELAFDATAETIQNPEVADKRKMILELQGVEQLENELAVISKQIDRDPRVKFSKSALGIDRSKILDFKSKFPDLLNKIKSDEALATDLPSLRKVIKEVYSDILDTKEIAAVAKKIAGYTSSFLDQKKKTKGLMDVDTSLSEFVLEATEKDVIDKSVMKFLSSLLPSGYNTAASYFNDKARVKKARATFASFVTHLRDELKLPEDKILRILHTQYKGMYASASKIGDGRFNVELIDGIYELVDKGSEAGSTHRGQVFENVDDFYRLAGVDNYKAKLKEIDTKTFAEKSKAAVKDKNYEGRLKQAKEAREAVQMIMEYYIGSIKDVDSALDYGDLLMLAKMLGSNMNSPMKRAANLAYIAEGVESMDPDSMGKLTEYEHMVPTSVKILEMVAAYVNNGKLPDGFWDNYEVAVIPKSMDKVLIKNGLRDFLPVMFKKGDENWRRYYNKQTLGEDNMVPLVSIKTGEVGKIIGADFVKASNLLVSGNINNKGAQLIGRTSIKYSKAKGMSTFDFDETLIIDGDNSIIATDPATGQVVKISSSDWPIKGPDLAASGFEFDFSDFANVRGGKEGPLLQKMKNQIVKYGNKNVFVLTARQQASALPIQQWLKSKGIDLSIENITGLGKSEGSAKGEWMLQKFAEGYNDMYFVDDAMSNVKAVKDVLDALDIKSKVVQAKIKFSKNASIDFNKMLEKSKGIRADVEVSSAAAKIRGAKKGRFDFFVPPSAEDFKGLIYSFLGKGKQGEADLLWFKDNLFDPFAKGIREMDSIKQTMTEEYKAIKKSFPTTIKGLNENIAGTDFTLDNAIRVYLWKEAGFEIPGLSEREVNILWRAVRSNPNNEAFARALSVISRSVDGYTKPSEFWVAETIASDLSNIVNKVNREQYLSGWIENKNIVFSKENLNKIESIYGTNFREALENILFRMESGSNRPSGQDKVVNRFINWINGSVGAVMFFNTRSAVLQTLSIVNFINFKENNILAAAKGFANQKQFWADFAMIYNSDMLKQRRAGLKIDVSASELTDAFSKGKSRPEAVIAYLLQIGFTPTQIADSFAISMGGSTYYRNMLNKYMKDGMSKADAEAKAFLDFQEIAEETQQSSRPDMISQQQSGTLGRIILAWANTPMQMTRLTKKALSDLVNGRGDIKSNVSKILYYGMIQNFIFGSLQTGLAFLAFGDEEDEEKTQTKEIRVANGMLDTLLRGTGVYGAAVSTVKNVILKWSEENSKGYGKRDWSRVVQEIISISPPIGTKVRKIMSAVKTYAYNKDVIKKMGPGINNPGWSVFGNVVEAATNAPVARVINKANNVKQVLTSNMDMWQRVAILLGWSTWSVGVEDQELVDAKAEVKADRKAASKERSKQKKTDSKKSKTNIKTVRCSGTRSSGGRCNIQVETNAKSAKCMYHKEFKEGSDTDGDGKKEYRCKSKTGSGKRCRNKTENKNKRCYAHQ